nr:polyprotein [Aconitum potyvirus 1]
MASFMIGTFQFTETASKSYKAQQMSDGDVLVKEYENNIAKAFAKLDACAPNGDKYLGATVKRVKNTQYFTLEEKPQARAVARLDLLERETTHKWLTQWEAGAQSVEAIVEPSAPRAQTVSEYRRPLAIDDKPSLAKRTKRVVHTPIRYSVENIIRAIANQNKNCKLDLEIISTKKATRARHTMWRNRLYVKAQTKHELGVRHKRDILVCEWGRQVLRLLVSKTAGNRAHDANMFTQGSSGIIIMSHCLSGNVSASRGNLFIVRGRDGEKLYDSQSVVTSHVASRMRHYSAGERFWKGYGRGFNSHTPSVGHQCRSDLDVEECGYVAAMATQVLFPCGHITCQQCADNFVSCSKNDLKEEYGTRIQGLIDEVQNKHPKFAHVVKFLSLFNDYLRFSNENIRQFSEAKRIIGDRKEAPFQQLAALNDLLIKVGECTSEEAALGTANLLELVRFQKNRTDNISGTSLTHFRNKVSSKIHVNLDLMCDNQLDDDGNFKWRQRGFHAKRMFDNFYEVVNPSKGYDSFIVRTNPNGVRKTAIGNLVISTNMATFREQMRGEPVEPQALSLACTSKLKGSYVYPCCCVTTDTGKPIESEMLAPTKDHLVIGNTGDSKFVTVPKILEDGMYVAKEGYCYVNIFVAMLINVSDVQAKDYTRRVRDYAIPTLGKWPTLINLATVCHFLTILYPDIKSAELPRILVDHKTCTMHVVDSFGSLSTGYHILKANTVGQLIKFANDELESDMKLYAVGGLHGSVAAESSEDAAVIMLARGIYRPKELKSILEHDPTLLVYSLLSPCVLIAMYKNRTFELAVSEWLQKDTEVASLCNQLEVVARKISVSKVLAVQQQLIAEQASQMIRSVERSQAHSPSRHFVRLLLARIIENQQMDKELIASGFTQLRLDGDLMREKKFLEALAHSWRDLSWSERCTSIWRSRKHSQSGTGPSKSATSDDLNVTWRERFNSLRGGVAETIRDGRSKIGATIKRKSNELVGKVTCKLLLTSRLLCPDIFRMVNVLTVMYLLLQIFTGVRGHIQAHQQLKIEKQRLEDDLNFDMVMRLYNIFYERYPTNAPSLYEFEQYLQKTNQSAYQYYMKVCGPDADDEKVEFQAKGACEIELERTVAFVALIMMMFDAERSDCVYKVLSKLRGLMAPIGTESVAFQSIDTVKEILGETKMAIDIEIDTENHQMNRLKGTTFSDWWQNQISQGRTIPHYRTEGHFMEFTRANAQTVANSIAHSEHNDLLIMGAVGSGKSTGLPFYLSKKGKVLIIEPTKPLAENVHKQLQGNPFMTQATLKMRGCNVFGSAPIHVQTSGYALHYFAHNVAQLAEFKFIIFDECHVHDSAAMAFRCLLSEYDYGGKILKVSATPPGREAVFSTQHAVQVKMEENLTFQQFVQMQGTGANGDVIQSGDNILVYVSSYNEVDSLSKLLLDAKHKVTKVDGRTMKMGQVEIPTSGTRDKKHFIVATNIIENGVTLDIDVVVDFGMKVVPELDSDNRLIRYTKVSISYGERIQRLGRVGRNKEGTALRIGATEKGLSAVPNIVATEAAFYSFAYGLPVMTNGVAVGVVANCTVPQARTVLHFELPIFYMLHLVRFDGSMHPALHACLKGFKLRDSEIILNKMAIPNSGVKQWLTAGEYSRIGARNSVDEFTRIPFFSKDVPDKIHEQVWEAVVTFKRDAGFGKIQSASACKVAYTLQTDAASITRTVCIIEELIKNEVKKQEYFQTASGIDCGSGFSLVSLTNAIRSRHMSNHTAENIAILEAAKGQLEEFRNLGIDPTTRTVTDFGALECVQFQSADGISKQLGLKGKWNKPLITKDILVAGFTMFGGMWMIYNYLKRAITTNVEFQASGKRQNQKRRFQIARNNKHAFEVNPDETDVEHYFGEAYGKKAQGKGRTRGMGAKSRRFYNMYGFDPAEYTFARYVDPLTGYTLDESALTEVKLVQEHFGKIRHELRMREELEPEAIDYHKKIEVYFVKDLAKQVLKIDMDPHNPFEIGRNTESIAGYPERKGELRQMGKPTLMSPTLLPAQREYEFDEPVVFESKATFYGMRDYNPISSSVCLLANESDGYEREIHGIGYGSMIITNQHLFQHNNGTLSVQSHRGKFFIPNTTQLKMYPFPGRDLLIIQMPKDFPPFPQKLKFRSPVSGDRVCMIGSNFQDKYISSVVSESSVISQKDESVFYRHWISTKTGHCGLPMVSVKDGYILGIHSLTSKDDASGFLISFPQDMEKNYLQNAEQVQWTKKWRLNVDLIDWGTLNLTTNKPDNLFRLSKDLLGLMAEPVEFQAHENRWLYERLGGNLHAVARTTNQLVTKHVVKGKCLLFATYLETNDEAKQFFQPLMGAYQKSRLNKEAYIKDLFKYNSPTTIGVLEPDKFERAEALVMRLFERVGFSECEYVTCPDAIFSALNMKAAVGALYHGKKKDYFDSFSEADKAQILKDSCYRLYAGKMGVWNGSLKAELRPLEKVQANKTRSFTAAPIDTLLGGKVCVDDFNNQFYSLNLKAPWSVGMTKFYGGWNELMTSLPDGWIYCDADGSQFDSSLTPYLINAVLNLRLHFMEEWDIGEKMLENLYTEIVYTPIATPDGTVIKKYKGNNSGQPSTVVDNTIMVILAMYYSGEVYNPTLSLDDYCKFFVNGDDLLIAVHPNHVDFLQDLQNSFQHLGLKYTFTSRYHTREELWFMSHKAIKVDGVYIPKLEEERIVSILEWDRAVLPEHRLEAICASMIEAWGYPSLLHQIRKFYYWVLEQAPYSVLSSEGKAPYISEVALKHLYLNQIEKSELERYMDGLDWSSTQGIEEVEFQANDTYDAGKKTDKPEDVEKNHEKENKELTPPPNQEAGPSKGRDKDVDVGTKGTFQVPRLKSIGSKMTLPRVGGRVIVNLEHLLTYEPEQVDLSNTRATRSQFDSWYNGIKGAYDLNDSSMGVVLNGLMVWCIENGTSPNIHGHWTMMDGDEQVEYPLRPVVEMAQPTLRQIMSHFSALAEAYIEKRNATKPYMPRYGLLRNLRDLSLARYAFDFYEVTARTPVRAREAHMQMKAAALRNSDNKMFGLDGNSGDKEEDTERHTANDVNRNMHHLMGVRM